MRNILLWETEADTSLQKSGENTKQTKENPVALVLACCWCYLELLQHSQPHKSNICLTDFLLSWSPASLSGPLSMFIGKFAWIPEEAQMCLFTSLNAFSFSFFSRTACLNEGGGPGVDVMGGHTHWWRALNYGYHYSCRTGSSLGSTVWHTWPGYDPNSAA